MRAKITPYLCDEQAEEIQALGPPLPERYACPFCIDKESHDPESLAWHINTFHDERRSKR